MNAVGLFKRIEKVKLRYILIWIAAVISVRNFIEPLSTGYELSLKFFAHYSLSYVTILLSLVLLANAFTGGRAVDALKIFGAGVFVILFAPIFDLIHSGGAMIDYMGMSNTPDLLKSFLTFGGNFTGRGLTPGMRIEVAIILCFVIFYVRTMTGLWIRAVAAGLLGYIVLFAYGGLLYWLELGSKCLSLSLFNKQMIAINIYLLVFFVLLNLFFRSVDRNAFASFWRKLRYMRMFHYFGVFCLGLFLKPMHFRGDILTPLALLNAFLAIFYAGVFSMITNDVIDVRIDSVSNRDRPLVDGSISRKDYLTIAFVSLPLALVHGFFSRTRSLTQMSLVALFMAGYALYSLPPLRLKRIPLFSKVLIGVNSLAVMMLGYAFNNGRLDFFPRETVAFMLIPFSLAVNFIDLKDAAGDAAAGIKTLPVLLGDRYAKILISVFVMIAFVCFPFMFSAKAFLLPSILAGSAMAYFINRREYSERPVFLIYLASLYSVMIYMFVR